MVAVVAPVTSRGTLQHSVENTPFVKYFLHTLLTSLAESEDAGFDVVIYVGYDKGDPVWDTPDTIRDMPAILKDKIQDYYSGGAANAPGLGEAAMLEQLEQLGEAPGVAYKAVKCESKCMVGARADLWG
jgi:hypothetical protein